MKTKHLFNQLDHDRIVLAIAEAERHTSGEIRVFVSHRKTGDPQRAAVRQFLKLGMNKTTHRNAVLIFLAPESQNFAIIGDEAIHSRCGEAFWEQVAGAMRGLFQQAKFMDGIIHGIHAAGRVLAEHFPSSGAGNDELPNSVVER
ncbi:MAG TPA: TPM domain-containing protein [Verrucomicrobiae bacterium]|nr:TPM domain-containing protein [Verrucomicrobiae bacterium]